MPLVKIVTEADVVGPDSEVLQAGVEQYGKALNTWGAILNKPGLYATYLPFLRQVAGPGSLDPALKDMSALLVGSLNHCPYTVSHRYASARRNGVSDELLRDVVARKWDALDEPTRLVLEVTTALTIDPPLIAYADAHQVVNPAALEALKAEYSDAQVVELVMSIAIWNALSRFHRVMDFDFDMPPAPDGIDPR